jgi:hypothetical protein
MLSPLRLPWMPETSAYYHIAYTVALGIYTLYAVSLYVRRNKVRRRP